MLYICQTDNSFEETCEKIKDGAAQNKLGVLSVIDLHEKIVSKGIEFAPQCRIIEVCSPMQAKTVLQANMMISTVLPCRISVFEEAGKVKIATLKPTAVLSMFGSPEIQPVAEQMEELIIKIINFACQK